MSAGEPSLPIAPEQLPVAYDRPARYEGLVAEPNVYVAMRDGIEICADVYRPEGAQRVPALLAIAVHNKDLQGPDWQESMPPQPAWSTLWTGPQEAGDTRFFVSRGYAHVIANPRGVGKSHDGGDRTWDAYDLIEWIAAQPWCDGNVGMVGISGFGAEQMHAVRQKPPHLKAVFAFDPRGAYGHLGGFRDEYPGGMIHLFRYLLAHFAVAHDQRNAPEELSPERERMWQAAMDNPDFRMYPHLYNVLTMKGQHMPAFFNILIDPFEEPGTVERSEAEFAQIETPVYTGSGWYGYTYKTHLQGAQSYWRHLDHVPRKLLFAGPAHLERPFHGLHSELLRWYDHWLMGLDTGIMDDPPVCYWVSGANEWRSGADWPLPETRWTKLYLSSWERLRAEPFTPASADDLMPPDTFVQMPLSQTGQIARLRFISEPLTADLLIAGPSVLNLWAAIDQPDTNWIVVLKDLGPDPSVRTAREGEWELPEDLPERELTRGWLKASNRALDPERSRAFKPFHRLTRDAAEPVTPGEVTEYSIEILATANLFRTNHRICLEITSMDRGTGVAGATNVEYVPYHVCSATTTVHHIYHDTARPSHLLLPVIPDNEDR